jgi:hypothetical protein
MKPNEPTEYPNGWTLDYMIYAGPLGASINVRLYRNGQLVQRAIRVWKPKTDEYEMGFENPSTYSSDGNQVADTWLSSPNPPSYEMMCEFYIRLMETDLQAEHQEFMKLTYIREVF